MFRRSLLASALFSLGTAAAGDWPQWRGPNRSAVAADFTPPAAWPKELQKKWTAPVGNGVSSPALVGGKLYTFGYEGGNEVIRCLDAGGKEVWKDQYPAKAASGPASGFPAARATPAVADGKVVTMGVQGTLSCLDAVSGKVVWRKDSTGGVPGFATSSSPLLIDGLCVVQTGGDRGGAVVAYALADGAEKWKATTDGTKYASPALVTVGDLKAVVVETAGTVAAVGLADGKALWSTNFATRYNASTPTVEGQVVYYSGSSQGTRAVKLEKADGKLAGKELWSNKDGSTIYNSPVVADGLIFGLSERNEIFCLDAAKGETLWTKAVGGAGGQPGGGSGQPGGGRPGGGRPGGGMGGGRGGYGCIVAAGPVLFSLTPAGQLVVFKPSREKYEEVASYKVATGNTYAYPIVTTAGVYVRDGDTVAFLAFQ